MGIAGYLNNDAVRTNIMGIVGPERTTRFIASVVSAVQANPALAACDNKSILSAALLGEALDLSPSPQLGQFYMVPYKNKGVSSAQFQLGASGYKQLAMRSGQYRRLVVSDVKQGELIEFNPITEEITFAPVTDAAMREKLPVIGYYAMFELINGFRKEIYWSREQMDAHAKRYSKSYAYDLKNGGSSSVWSSNFDAMARKTMIRTLIRTWGPMSIELEKAYAGDMAVLDEQGKPEYVDNSPVTAEDIAVEVAENGNQQEIVLDTEGMTVDVG